ncbi:MAG: peptidylprolyl isomerase [Pyrinomonadaceae bacterium]
MRRFFLLAILIGVIGGGAVGSWWMWDSRASAARTEAAILKELSDSDIDLILGSDLGTGDLRSVSQSPEDRKAFVKGLGEYLALAGQARREGMADDPQFVVNFEYKEDKLLADLYQAKLSNGPDGRYTVPAVEIEAIWKDRKNEQKFERTMETLRSIQRAVARDRGDEIVIGPLQGGALEKIRDNWARARFLAEKARSDMEFMARPDVVLRVKLLEAGILSNDYIRKYWNSAIKASDAEIDEFIASHPEYDLGLKLAAAKGVLARARSGENFTKLAAEFSEDRVTKDKGGLYENITPEATWPEVEKVALSLDVGQIAPQLVETTTGYHIVKLEKKARTTSQDEAQAREFSFRHILFQKAYANPMHVNPQIPAPFISPKEIARQKIESDKRSKFVSAILETSQIRLPEYVS